MDQADALLESKASLQDQSGQGPSTTERGAWHHEIEKLAES